MYFGHWVFFSHINWKDLIPTDSCTREQQVPLGLVLCWCWSYWRSRKSCVNSGFWWLFIYERRRKGPGGSGTPGVNKSFLLGSVLFCLGHILSLCMTICSNNTLCVISPVIWNKWEAKRHHVLHSRVLSPLKFSLYCKCWQTLPSLEWCAKPCCNSV